MLLSNYLSLHSSGWRFCLAWLSANVIFSWKKTDSWCRKHSSKMTAMTLEPALYADLFRYCRITMDIPVFPLLYHITFSKNECILSYKYKQKKFQRVNKCEALLIGMWLLYTPLNRENLTSFVLND